jgi:PTH1 family peptidyl-tRNA hydrolase
LRAIVGLGNPGPKYSRTRHNAGFKVLEELARRHGVRFAQRDLYNATRGSIGGQGVLFMEPLTFMNLSGKAVVRGMRKFGFEPEDLIVVCDEMDMDTGRVKIKQGGSSGGHNGIQSIIDMTGYRDFIRVKVGIGRDPRIPSEKYVLSKFTPDEAEAHEEAISRAADAVEYIVTEGLETAMNMINRRPSISS